MDYQIIKNLTTALSLQGVRIAVLEKLLVEKGIIQASELRDQIAQLTSDFTNEVKSALNNKD